MNHDPHDLVANTARVRVRSGALGQERHVMAEGKVVAYSQHPQICVEADDGTQSWWPVTLPVDVVPALPPEPPVGSFVHLAAYYGVYERLERGWLPANEAAGKPLEWEVLLRLNSGQKPVLLVPVDGPTGRVLNAAKTWRSGIADSVARGSAEPRVWADDEEIELINAVDALNAAAEPASP